MGPKICVVLFTTFALLQLSHLQEDSEEYETKKEELMDEWRDAYFERQERNAAPPFLWNDWRTRPLPFRSGRRSVKRNAILKPGNLDLLRSHCMSRRASPTGRVLRLVV